MSKSSKESVFRLYQMADQQGGFFTARQAIESGYPDAVHPYHVRNGDWTRVQRGIYRLARYPEGERPELMIGYLWSRNRQDRPEGVYSHRTALEIHGWTPPNQQGVHLTVPQTFRRMAPPPAFIRLYRAPVSADERQVERGVEVTTLARTVWDLEQTPLYAEWVASDTREQLAQRPDVIAYREKRHETRFHKRRPVPRKKRTDTSWAVWND